MTSRRLIAVSWCMPPALFPRSIQVARLLKGLRAFGWSSTVVTPRIEDLSQTDVLDDTLSEIYGEQRLAPVNATSLDLDEPESFRRWKRANDGTQPDDDQLWAENAAAAVKRLDRVNRASALVTFAQPWRDHLVGLELRWWKGFRPWIAHFSDPWVDSPYLTDAPPAQKNLQHEREAQVVRRADVVVFTNQYAADLVMAKYPEKWRTRVRVVPHAMDRELGPRIEALRTRNRPDRSGRLKLSHVGNLFIGRRTAHGLFEAVAALKRRRPLDRELELVFVGEGSGWHEAREKAAALELDGIVTFEGRVSHLASLAAMSDTDVLVLIDAPAATNVFLPSKLADYLMAEKPILGLTPPVGPSGDLIRALGYPVLEPTNVRAIAEAIEDLLQRHAAGSLGASPTAHAYAERHSLDAVAGAFADILNEAVRTRRWRMLRLGVA